MKKITQYLQHPCWLLGILIMMLGTWQNTMAQDLVRVTIECSPQEAGVTIITVGNVESQPDGSYLVQRGDYIEMRAFANESYRFEYWSIDDDLWSWDENLGLFINDDTIVTANFYYDSNSPGDGYIDADLYKLTLKTNPKNGYVPWISGDYYSNNNGVYTVPQGGVLTVEAYNISTFKFKNWTANGEIVSTSTYFDYTMPGNDVELVANYEFDPQSPADPEAPARKYPVKVVAEIKGLNMQFEGRYFNVEKTRLAEGETIDIQGYNYNSIKLTGWRINGKEVENFTNPLMLTMGNEAVTVVGVFEFDPASPSNPGANYWDPETGLLIMEDFAPGNLYNAIYNKVGWENISQIRTLQVIGKCDSNDFWYLSEMSNLETLDYSRTSGLTAIPSWTFEYSSIAEIILPSSISSIGWYAFYGCNNLGTITIYAEIPPQVDEYTFLNFSNMENCVLQVPSGSMFLYSQAPGWKDFYTITPIDDNSHTLQVNLPEDAADGRYKNYSIEIVNKATTARNKYVVTDRLIYSFIGVHKNDVYDVYLISPTGLEVGVIYDVAIEDEDLEVNFENLKALKSVAAIVLTPDGQDVSASVKVEWFEVNEDGSLKYLRSTATLGETPVGQLLKCRVSLPQALAMQYSIPADYDYVVTEDGAPLQITLQKLLPVLFTGSVLDDFAQPKADVNVSLTQLLNGLYPQTFVAKTNANGAFEIQGLRSPMTIVTYSASECVNMIDSIGDGAANVDKYDLGQRTLRRINSARINFSFTYQEAADADETPIVEDFYNNYKNVVLSAYNKTQGRAHNDLSQQYPTLVILDQNVAEGDVIDITAQSATNAFDPVTVSCTIQDNKASVVIPIVSKGSISAKFDMTENAAVSALLYNSAGRLLKTADYKEAAVSFSALDNGQYMLVTIGKSSLIAGMQKLASLSEIGLEEGIDYVTNKLTVNTGVISAANIAMVPLLDENRFRYTSSASSFSINKVNIAPGNFLTLKSYVNFKTAYRDKVSNVKMIFDLPTNVEVVAGSMMFGSDIIGFEVDSNNQVIVDLGSRYNDYVRFVVIPVDGGDVTFTAKVSFDFDGNTIIQPIGSAICKVKDLELNVPSIIASEKLGVSGLAPARSTIIVYDDNTVIGQSTALANGQWSAACSLIEPSNRSKHRIYAVVTLPSGVSMKSEVKECVYDSNAIAVSKVKMYHDNPEMGRTYEVVYDFQNPPTTASTYIYYIYNRKFTFTIEFTNNSPEAVGNVVLYVHTGLGNVKKLNATYDAKKDLWVASGEFGNYYDGDIPVNVSLDFDSYVNSEIDANQLKSAIDLYNSDFEAHQAEIQKITDIIDNLEVEYEKEVQDTDLINQLQDQLFALIGGIETGELFTDEESIQVLMDRCQADIDEFAPQSSNFMSQSLVEAIESVEDLELFSCANSTPESLIADGYQAIDMNNGEQIYLLCTDNELRIADLTSGTGYLVTLSIDAAELAMARAQGDFNAEMGLKIQAVKNAFEKIRSYLSAVAGCIDEITSKLTGNISKMKVDISDLEMTIKYLENNPGSPLKSLFLAGLRAQRNILSKEVKIASNILSWIDKNISGLKFGRIGGGLFAAFDLWAVQQSMLTDLTAAIDTYYSIPAVCENNPEAADNLRAAVWSTGIGAGVFYSAQIVADAVAIATAITGISTSVVTGGSSLSAVGISIGFAVANLIATEVYEANYQKNLNYLRSQIKALKCNKEEEDKDFDYGFNEPDKDKDKDKGDHTSDNPDSNPQIDPSGFVYEAVEDNRVEGVQATVYYKETVTDMYGNEHEEVVMWNAEEYAQKNPLFTDENGMYRWDVPSGLWQVKFEKNGYETTYSDWLPVPPPQLEVNIPITQLSQPEVTEAHAYKDGIVINFSKYMSPATMNTSYILVTADDLMVPGQISLSASAQDDAANANALDYVTSVRFVPDEPLSSAEGEIKLLISQKVRSYAGVNMANNYSQVFNIEKEITSITANDSYQVEYGGERKITVDVVPYEAAVGKVLKIANSSNMIASIDCTEAVIDENGQVEINVSGLLPGVSELKFSIDGCNVTGSTTLNIVPELFEIFKPTASRASGTQVYRNTEIKLSTETANAVIYYTTDGSCPCDPDGTRMRYISPIKITDDMTINAIAVVSNEGESEIVELNYKLMKSTMDMNLLEGWTWISHNMESPIDPKVIAADSKVQRILSQTQEVIRDPVYGVVGDLKAMNAKESYRVKSTAAVTSSDLTDYAWNPATPIAIKAGWNWLGYPAIQTMTVAEAFEPTVAELHDAIIGQEGFAEFDGENWVGTLNVLNPGMGYLYKSQSPKNVVYNTSIVSVAAAQNIPGISKSSALTIDIHKYPSIMPVIATIVTGDGSTLSNEDYCVYAFSGSECRGIGRIVNGLVMMNVYGNTGDVITLQVTDKESDVEYLNNAILTLEENVIGHLDNPYTITIDSTNNLTQVSYDGNVKVEVNNGYLKVLGIDCENVEVIEIYDIEGKKLIRETRISDSGLNVSMLNTGIYVVIVDANGEYTYHKIVIK